MTWNNWLVFTNTGPSSSFQPAKRAWSRLLATRRKKSASSKTGAGRSSEANPSAMVPLMATTRTLGAQVATLWMNECRNSPCFTTQLFTRRVLDLPQYSPCPQQPIRERDSPRAQHLHHLVVHAHHQQGRRPHADEPAQPRSTGYVTHQ